MPASYTPPAPLTERDIELLRLLGRVGVASGMALHALAWPEEHAATRNRHLGRLVERGLLWRASVPHPNRDPSGRPRGQSPGVYGLTECGKELLGLERVEGESTYERLIARPDDAADAEADVLQQDVAAGDWLLALLARVGREPTLAGVQVQRAYAIHDAGGAVSATLGALIVFAFDPLRPSPPQPWPLPWLGGEGRVLNWGHHWLALEVDSGKVGRRQLAAQAAAYRGLAERRCHGRLQLLDDVLRPVIVAASEARASSIREVWAEVWPGNPALMVTQGPSALASEVALDVDAVLAAILPRTVSPRDAAPVYRQAPSGQFSW